ncbi:MAG: helix-turn-helix domain-containing protein [Deltaproteobacteria bacterium]|nr:helix-turn-helix domain-containing protein [Deltaproteobacteria bacterium]
MQAETNGKSSTRKLTVQQAAAEWQLHPETLRKAIRAGDLPAAWVGSGYRIVSSDIEAWIKRTWSQPRPHRTEQDCTQ